MQALDHPHIGIGKCPICGHYGEDCDGFESEATAMSVGELRDALRNLPDSYPVYFAAEGAPEIHEVYQDDDDGCVWIGY